VGRAPASGSGSSSPAVPGIAAGFAASPTVVLPPPPKVPDPLRSG
jgi:hypothetical protein